MSPGETRNSSGRLRPHPSHLFPGLHGQLHCWGLSRVVGKGEQYLNKKEILTLWWKLKYPTMIKTGALARWEHRTGLEQASLAKRPRPRRRGWGSKRGRVAPGNQPSQRSNNLGEELAYFYLSLNHQGVLLQATCCQRGVLLEQVTKAKELWLGVW